MSRGTSMTHHHSSGLDPFTCRCCTCHIVIVKLFLAIAALGSDPYNPLAMFNYRSPKARLAAVTGDH